MAPSSLTVGLIQLTVGDDPAVNLPATVAMIRDAAAQGAQLVLTPEATNLLSPDRDWQARVLQREARDPTLAALRAEADEAHDDGERAAAQRRLREARRAE